MEPSCPLGTTRCIPQAKFHQKPYNRSFSAPPSEIMSSPTSSLKPEDTLCQEIFKLSSSSLCNFLFQVPLRVTKILVYQDKKQEHIIIERFSFECRKAIGFAFTTLRDWLKRFAPLFYPIRSKTKTNCDPLACIYPRFASATHWKIWTIYRLQKSSS